MDKSYVTLEQQVCVVCNQEFDTGALLLDKRLRERFDMHTVTGYGWCESCTEKREQGFIALVEVDPTKSTASGDRMQLEDAYRTGTICHIKREIAINIFDTVDDDSPPLMFVEPDVVKYLEKISRA